MAVPNPRPLDVRSRGEEDAPLHCSYGVATGERVVPFAVMNSSLGRTCHTHTGLGRRGD